VVLAALKASQPEVRAEAVRLLAKPAGEDLAQALQDTAAAVRFQAILRLNRHPHAAPLALLADPDPFLVSAAVTALGRAEHVPVLLAQAGASDPRMRLGVLLALRRSNQEKARKSLRAFLADSDPEVRRCAIQWVGEERLAEWAGQLEAAATKQPNNAALFKALLAARHLLAGGKPEAEPVDEAWLARVLHDADQPAAFRRLALRTLRPDHPAVAAARLGKLLKDADVPLRRQAARTLALRGGKGAEELLLALAKDESAGTPLRADAVLGLAGSAPARRVLLSLLDQPGLRRDALRSLRGAGQDAAVARALLAWWDKGSLPEAERPELAAQMLLVLRASKDVEPGRLRTLGRQATPRPSSPAAWQRYLAKGGDPAAGERVFFHPGGPGCYRCHRIDGNGAAIGPDLTSTGRSMSRERLIESILTPSKEIAPRYVSWRIVTQDGKVHVGAVVDEGPHSTLTLADAEGKLHTLKRQDIEERKALSTSIMPDNLHELMTPREFRDLVAYIAGREK
jgi:putative heme-binding domain-containing protein